jgi:hypothetical protein
MNAQSTTEPAELSAAVDREDVVEVVPARQSEAHGFHFKARASGRIYRLDAARDPHLPRFWCFRISRCTASGTVDPTENPLFGGDRMTRKELPAAADLQDATGKKFTAIRQPNARYGEPWDEPAFREETRRFVDEFNARRIAADEDAVALIVWLTRGRPDSAEDVA